MKSHLKPYGGPLTAREIAEGIAAAQANAERLLEDARLLASGKRFPSAVALAILSMEERGKVVILKRLALARNPDEVKAAWKAYRSHRAKNAGWVIPVLIAQGARTMKDFAPALDADAEHAAMLDGLKQVSFYTDCLGNRHWSVPEQIIDADLADHMIMAAERTWAGNPVSVREMELWMEIVGPHFDTPTMAKAVVQFQAALHEEGLSATQPQSLQAFIEGRPVAAVYRAAKRIEGEPPP